MAPIRKKININYKYVTSNIVSSVTITDQKFLIKILIIK